MLYEKDLMRILVETVFAWLSYKFFSFIPRFHLYGLCLLLYSHEWPSKQQMLINQRVQTAITEQVSEW